MNNKKKVLTISIVVIIFSVAVWGIASEKKEKSNLYNMLRLIDNVAVKTYSRYVDSIDTEKFVEHGIKGMLNTLDPHTQFFEKKQYEELKVHTRGSFGGLGIQIGVRDNVLTVISPIEDTPAYRQGIRAGDQIIKIEEKNVIGITTREAVDKLRGPKGSEVDITIRRKGEPEPIPYTITRDIIEIKSVPYYGVHNGIGYIRLSRFSRKAEPEVKAAVRDLKSKGVEGIVLDLRSNPGGLLSQAVSVSSLFLDKGDLIVYTKSPNPRQSKKYRNPNQGIYTDGPLAILINRGSASASEIIAGAIQDHDRGIVIGQRSFGKGLVQNVVPITEDKHLKITTAKYHVPSGRCIQKTDYLEKDASAIISERDSLSGDSNLDTLIKDGNESGKKDTVIRPLYFTDGGRKVHGGGGILPDVKHDPERMSRLQAELSRAGLFFSFAVDYTAKHEDLSANFKVNQAMIDSFRTFLNEEDFSYRNKAQIALDKIRKTSDKKEYSKETNQLVDKLEAQLEVEKDKQFSANSDFIKRSLRREIVSKLGGREKRYELVTIPNDEEIQLAIKKLGNPKTYQALLTPEKN